MQKGNSQWKTRLSDRIKRNAIPIVLACILLEVAWIVMNEHFSTETVRVIDAQQIETGALESTGMVDVSGVLSWETESYLVPVSGKETTMLVERTTGYLFKTSVDTVVYLYIPTDYVKDTTHIRSDPPK